MTNGSEPLLEARALTRVFVSRSGAEVRALDGVSLQVPAGAFVAVTGPSGCGKTTLLSLLGALDLATEGEARYAGQDLKRLAESGRAGVRRKIGFVFQGSPMVRGLPLWDNVTYALVPLGVGAAARRARAADLLARVGLGNRLDASPNELSGGERRRAGLARALACEPEAILADEPTADLDRASAERIAELLSELHATGTTVLVGTHDEAMAARAESRLELA
ncbi:MAG: ATP-binding cassette domain-containing protein [Planctomycetota bacterium]|nr:ATP-binding cassette domain-containing protein [Planctomycetota bacterium]